MLSLAVTSSIFASGLEGHYKYTSDPGHPLTMPTTIGGSVEDCDICHDFQGGTYNGSGGTNLRWLKRTIG